ncbi:MAG: PfkB family carbohydrate kinase, partial [Halobacteriaceae archaeon]
MIATVTLNPAVDYTVSIPDLSPDRVNRAEAGSVRYDAGGAGINVSLALAALGAETAATGVLGGFTGAYVRGELAGAPFAADFVDGDGVTRLNATVLAGGDAYKINQRGPETGERVVAAVADRVRQFDPATLVVGGSLPPGLDAGALDRLAAAGDWETALDVPGGLLEGVDAGRYSLCAPNRAELEAATDHPVGTVAACRRAAARLRERGFDRVVASLGADGALLVSAAGALYGE